MKLLPPSVSLEDIPSLQTRVLFWNCGAMRRNVSKYSLFYSFARVSSPSSTTRSVGYSCGRCRDGGKMRASSVSRAERWQVPSASINCDLEREGEKTKKVRRGRERKRKRKRRNRKMTHSTAIFSWFVGPNFSPFGTRATLRCRFCIHTYHRCRTFVFDRLRAWRFAKMRTRISGDENSVCNVCAKKNARRPFFSRGCKGP